MATNNLEALGMIETKGLVALVEACDAMLKAAAPQAIASSMPRTVAVPTTTTTRAAKSVVRRGVHCSVGTMPAVA